ncbi:Rapid ALkalinization Factor [Quillaja saponaria]|uniref:Rapid ALkalinization Factor n=1 Tax=Quillaja saponaria TaxID=32244 RepID=A0AAD7LYH7_QUISA|nr:Rapid ALkalinization Factor [Quillaja saponaria]
MAFGFFKLLLLLALIHNFVEAQVDDASIQLKNEILEWPWTMSVYNDQFSGNEVQEEEESVSYNERRSLYGRRPMHYYISYGALSANRIPCRPRSGRSYYTHNCQKASGPIHPYTRGCSKITRCRR